jgi:hypothetical protein
LLAPGSRRHAGVAAAEITMRFLLKLATAFSGMQMIEGRSGDLL